MLTPSIQHSPITPDPLKYTLSQGRNPLEKKELLDTIDAWQNAIKGRHRLRNMSERDRTRAERINQWYWNEVLSRKYEARSWRITPERALLFQQFRSDPNYHLKNLVEVVARGLVEDMLRAEGKDVVVSLTSDSDDVFSGVDLIVETRLLTGEKEYLGLDIAVSKNSEYLQKKEQRSNTICREFNAFK